MKHIFVLRLSELGALLWHLDKGLASLNGDSSQVPREHLHAMSRILASSL